MEKRDKNNSVQKQSSLKRKTDEVLRRGVEEIIDEESLREKLNSGKKLRIKFGIDPTASDLHLGHSVMLRKLKEFQDLGHQVIFLIGDYTGRIGDPSGKDSAREPLTPEQIEENMASYVEQAGKILDTENIEIRYNSEWYEGKKIPFLTDLLSRFTYSRLIERDEFETRIEKDMDITLLELIYPLLQGYDSVALEADVEIGGRDQKFNLLMGRKVQKKYQQTPQEIITAPLLIGTDGKKKMSKSYGNYIGFREEPFEMYSKVMSIPDEIIWEYFRLVTELPLEEVKDLKEKVEKGETNPREAKSKLAEEIVSFFFDSSAARKAGEEFNKVFKERELPSDIEELGVKEDELNVIDLLLKTELVSSKSEARRVVEQGGVKIIKENESSAKQSMEDKEEKINLENGLILQVGKRRFIKIKKQKF